MKYIFSVTSHLTMALSKRIADVMGYAYDDCVLLQLRDYKPSPRYEALFSHRISTSYNVGIDQGRVFSGANVFATRRNVRQFDELVDKELGHDEFIWYTPVCSNDICSLMVTKPNCVGFYVMEDGLASYRDYNPQTFTGMREVAYKLLLRPLFPRIFEVKNHFIEDAHPKFRGCVASSQRCFPLHQKCLTVVGFPFEAKATPKKCDAVISIDPIYQFVGMDTVRTFFERTARYITTRHSYANICYKMHPRFDAAINRTLKEAFVTELKKNLPDIEELSADVVLEEFVASTGADFYSCNSSTALYVSQTGSQCYNLLPLLCEIDPGAQRGYDKFAVLDAVSIPVKQQDI